MNEVVKLILDSTKARTIFVKGEDVLFEVQYGPSVDGPFEYTFNKYTHNHEDNSSIEVEGHAYIRFRVGGEDAQWTPAIKFKGTDAKQIELSVFEKILMWNREGEPAVKLFDLTALKGDRGEKGEQGYGLAWHKVLFYDELIAYNPGNISSGCNTCGGVQSTPKSVYPVVLVVGDNRTHTILSGEIGTYFKVDQNQTDWTLIDASHVGKAVRYYGFDGVDPATAIDAQAENTLAYKDTLWVWNGTAWNQLGNISTPSALVAPEAARATEGKFLNEYLNASTTLELTLGDIVEVQDQGIAPRHILNGTFDFGFNEGDGTVPIKVDVAQFSGWGLKPYTSTSGKVKQQVDTANIIGDGLTTELDTPSDDEDRKLVVVNAPDLVSDGTGLTTVDVVDNDGKTRKDLKVNTKLPLKVNEVNEVIIEADEKTISALTTDGSTIKLLVRSAADTDKGILAKHVNVDVVDINRGLDKDGISGKLYLVLDTPLKFVTDSAQGTVGALTIDTEGVEGKHIHPNTVDNTTALYVVNQKITLSIDTTMLAFTNGKLTIASTAWDSIPTNTLVTSLISKVNGTSSITFKDTVTLNHKDSTYIKATLLRMQSADPDNSSGQIDIAFDLDFDALESALNIPSGTADITYWGALEKANGNTQTIEQYISQVLANYVQFDTLYGNMLIDENAGLLLISSEEEGQTNPDTANARKLVMASDGNLGTAIPV